jgi:ubiquinone/menaquinone biosynthesis C-methylase UbiE
VSLETYYKDHWVTIEPERLDRYEEMFVWTPAQDALIEPANIQTGHTVADFGCGPGYLSVELLRRVGADGHVHSLDVNEDFLRRTQARVGAEGLPADFSSHQLIDGDIPLDDQSMDRIVTKNVMVYVDDPAHTFTEFRRIIRPGGRVHVIDSDFLMSVADPVPALDWRAFIDASAPAFRTPSIGRQLYRLAKEAGFKEVSVSVLARPDTKGRMLNFIANAAGYARLEGALDDAAIEKVVATAKAAVSAGSFMALNPQFLVTAVA